MAQPFATLADIGKLPPENVRRQLSEGENKLMPEGRARKKRPSLSGRSSASQMSFDDVSGIRATRRANSSIFQTLEAKKKKGPTLTFQARSRPGRMRLREIDPRRIMSMETGLTRVVIDWRTNHWDGANRLIDRLLPTSRTVQYTMKLTGAARETQVPENECEPSSEEDEISSHQSSDDDAIVNSDDEKSSSTNLTETNKSTATGSHAAGSQLGGGSCSGLTREMTAASRRRNKARQRITGWLSQYSGCTKGHGDRLMRKIYKPKCEETEVKMNSGVKELLMTSPPCFCSLQAVNFRNFLLGNRGVQALWPLLRYARALKSLNLSGNDIHDEGASHIISVLEADAQNATLGDGGLLMLDLSKNPITGSIAADLMKFNDKRKDILLVGLAETVMPMVKRQKILRQCLTKFAGVEPHVMLEAWRLAADPRDFVDRELFIQCERIVEGIHGAHIHDMTTNRTMGDRRRHMGWGEEDDDFDDNFLDDGMDRDRGSLCIGQDGFGGLDEELSDESSTLGQASESGGRDTALSCRSMHSPPPPPPRPEGGNRFDSKRTVAVFNVRRERFVNPYQQYGKAIELERQEQAKEAGKAKPGDSSFVSSTRAVAPRQSWAMRRRQGCRFGSAESNANAR